MPPSEPACAAGERSAQRATRPRATAPKRDRRGADPAFSVCRPWVISTRCMSARREVLASIFYADTGTIGECVVHGTVLKIISYTLSGILPGVRPLPAKNESATPCLAPGCGGEAPRSTTDITPSTLERVPLAAQAEGDAAEKLSAPASSSRGGGRPRRGRGGVRPGGGGVYGSCPHSSPPRRGPPSGRLPMPGGKIAHAPSARRAALDLLAGVGEATQSCGSPNTPSQESP